VERAVEKPRKEGIVIVVAKVACSRGQGRSHQKGVVKKSLSKPVEDINYAGTQILRGGSREVYRVEGKQTSRLRSMMQSGKM